jgi:hypothetical protein
MWSSATKFLLTLLCVRVFQSIHIFLLWWAAHFGLSWESGGRGAETSCRNPNLAKCGGEAQHLEKLGIWSPPGLLNVQSSTARGKTPLIRGVLGVVGKVLKRRYRKCPRIGNSDICSPSYGQKKGRESNSQFDSRPLKVGNRCLPDIIIGSAIRRWKDLDEGYNFGLDLVAIQLGSRELRRFKVPGVPPGQNRDSISGVPGICAIRM